MENEATSIRNVDENSQYFLCFGGKCVLLKRIFPDFGSPSPLRALVSSEYSKVLFVFFPPLAASRLKSKAAGAAGTKYGRASY